MHLACVRRCLGGLLAVVLLLLAHCLAFPSVAAEGPQLGGVVVPPPLAQSRLDSLLSRQQALTSTSVAWKVVYVVGAVDGVDGTQTQDYINDARSNVSELRKLGMSVVEFYPPNNHWNDIKAAASDALVLVYAGHGVSWGGNPPLVGGFSLQPGESVHPDKIGSELRMLPGAIVLFNHVCFSAGSSATDTSAISAEEAQRRVAQYSLPFLEAGLVGYYANWYYGFPKALLSYLAQNMTLSQAYEAFYDYNAATAERYQHPQRPEYAMWLDKDNWGGNIQYNYAFVGDAGRRLTDVPTPLSISVSPSSVYIRAALGAGPQTLAVTISASDGLAIGWTATVIGGDQPWLKVEPSTGLTGSNIYITITPPSVSASYQAQVLIRTDDTRVANPELLLTVNLEAQYWTILPMLPVGKAH